VEDVPGGAVGGVAAPPVGMAVGGGGAGRIPTAKVVRKERVD